MFNKCDILLNFIILCDFLKKLLFLYENEEKMLYFWVQMNEDLIIETCEFSYVVDYIVVNFTKRKENMFLEKKYGENLTGYIKEINI